MSCWPTQHLSVSGNIVGVIIIHSLLFWQTLFHRILQLIYYSLCELARKAYVLVAVQLTPKCGWLPLV